MHCAEYDPATRDTLLRLAFESIEHGLAHGRPANPAAALRMGRFAELRATFVTLTLAGSLRGCTGALEARRSLAEDVAASAYGSAFQDPRFAPLNAAELSRLAVEISVLSPLQRLRVASEDELLAQLRPGQDGLVIELGMHRATFLPKVWEQLPDPVRFLAALKHKAGLAQDFWSPSIVIHRYRTESFASPWPPAQRSA